mgnify:CR=1 FL=1
MQKKMKNIGRVWGKGRFFTALLLLCVLLLSSCGGDSPQASGDGAAGEAMESGAPMSAEGTNEAAPVVNRDLDPATVAGGLIRGREGGGVSSAAQPGRAVITIRP